MDTLNGLHFILRRIIYLSWYCILTYSQYWGPLYFWYIQKICKFF